MNLAEHHMNAIMGLRYSPIAHSPEGIFHNYHLFYQTPAVTEYLLQWPPHVLTGYNFSTLQLFSNALKSNYAYAKVNRSKNIVTSLIRLTAGRLLFAILFTACLFTGLVPAQAQDKVVQGRVTTETGSPVGGASITIKGTSTGTTSNVKGEYSLSVSKGATLVISNVGFSSKEVTVGDDNTINVQLSTATQSFDEVVVVGYGTRRKKTLPVLLPA